MFEITVSGTFNASHAVRMPDGDIESIHDHPWQVKLAVSRSELDGADMVMDFHRLEGILKQIHSTCEGRSLNNLPYFQNAGYSPTAERVAQWLASEVTTYLPAEVELVRIEVTESKNCTATWRPD